MCSVVSAKTPGRIIDVRSPSERNGESPAPYGISYNLRCGSIPTSHFISYENFIDVDTERFISPIEILALMHREGFTDLNENLIITCFKGSRAAMVAELLREAGFVNVKVHFGSWN